MGDQGTLCKCVESRTTVEITRYRMSGMLYVCYQNTLLAMICTIYFTFNTASLVEHVHGFCSNTSKRLILHYTQSELTLCRRLCGVLEIV